MRLARERRDPGLERRAFEAAERGRARGLADLLAEAAADVFDGVDPELAAERRRRERRVRAAAALASRRPQAAAAGEPGRELAERLEALRAVEAEIRRRHPRYARLLEPPRLLTADVERRLLDETTLLLAYALGGERSYLWALGRDGFASFELPPRAEIEALARAAHADLSVLDRDRRKRRCRTLDRLGRALLGPVAERLDGRRLAIVPDGVLHYLPFAALPEPPADAAAPADCGRPLVERREIVVLPSLAALDELRARLDGRPRAPRTVAVVADPVFRADDPRLAAGPSGNTSRSARGGDGGPPFERLPWSRREAGTIAAAARGAGHDDVFLALDFAAGRRALARLGPYRVIHFATHGLLDGRHPELSGLVLSLVDETGRPVDGFVRLRDVFALELGADLVVLSGCRTALGRDVRGEGLVGLTRGFFHAGAPRVVASLWRVDDRATAELMGRFYRALLRDRAPPAAALRRAQLELRREGRWRDPFYWAPFVLQGDWRPPPEAS